jgi:hypothetical protein
MRRSTPRLHIGMAGAHLFIEGRLGERERLLQAGAELGFARQQRRRSGGKLGPPSFSVAQGHQPGGGQHGSRGSAPPGWC